MTSTFIIASVMASIISVMLLKIFEPEISGFIDNVRKNKPQSTFQMGDLK